MRCASATGQAGLPLLHGVFALHPPRARRVALSSTAMPQHQLLAIVFQQQLAAARKSVGQGVAHGPLPQGWLPGEQGGAGAARGRSGLGRAEVGGGHGWLATPAALGQGARMGAWRCPVRWLVAGCRFFCSARMTRNGRSARASLVAASRMTIGRRNTIRLVLRAGGFRCGNKLPTTGQVAHQRHFVFVRHNCRRASHQTMMLPSSTSTWIQWSVCWSRGRWYW